MALIHNTNLERSQQLFMDKILVVLNSAPATLVSNIAKTGIPMAIKDRGLYWDEYLAKSLEAEDFAEFVQSFWKIYVRSKSLT